MGENLGRYIMSPPRAAIVWIASYPRSGNTFLRLLLANYFVGRFNPISLHTLADIHFGEHIERVWRKVSGEEAEVRSEETEWRARAAYFDILRVTTPPSTYRIVKVHTINAERWGKPAHIFKPGDRVIYVVRSPLDVVVSLASFHGWDVTQALSHMLDPAAMLRDHTNGYEVTGSWADNVMSWVGVKDCPLLVIPYTQLLKDSAGTLSTCLDFIGSVPNPIHAKNAAAWTDFEKLRIQEKKGGFPEVPQDSRRPQFFRVGKSDQWRQKLSPDQISCILDTCGAAMKAAGMEIPSLQA